jgi:hypothetical protein
MRAAATFTDAKTESEPEKRSADHWQCRCQPPRCDREGGDAFPVRLIGFAARASPSEQCFFSALVSLVLFLPFSSTRGRRNRVAAVGLGWSRGGAAVAGRGGGRRGTRKRRVRRRLCEAEVLSMDLCCGGARRPTAAAL